MGLHICLSVALSSEIISITDLIMCHFFSFFLFYLLATLEREREKAGVAPIINNMVEI